MVEVEEATIKELELVDRLFGEVQDPVAIRKAESLHTIIEDMRHTEQAEQVDTFMEIEEPKVKTAS